jgi:hypothetical protein
MGTNASPAMPDVFDMSTARMAIGRLARIDQSNVLAGRRADIDLQLPAKRCHVSSEPTQRDIRTSL